VSTDWRNSFIRKSNPLEFGRVSAVGGGRKPEVAALTTVCELSSWTIDWFSVSVGWPWGQLPNGVMISAQK